MYVQVKLFLFSGFSNSANLRASRILRYRVRAAKGNGGIKYKHEQIKEKCVFINKSDTTSAHVAAA